MGFEFGLVKLVIVKATGIVTALGSLLVDVVSPFQVYCTNPVSLWVGENQVIQTKEVFHFSLSSVLIVPSWDFSEDKKTKYLLQNKCFFLIFQYTGDTGVGENTSQAKIGLNLANRVPVTGYCNFWGGVVLIKTHFLLKIWKIVI